MSIIRTQGRRELSKAARKSRILNAARALIQESGDVGFSMRGLAERAGLSVMTLYNLVGSQQEILLQILVEDMATTTVEREALGYEDALDEMFGMIPYIRAAFSAEFRYRRTIVLSLFQKSAASVRREARNIYMTGWSRILEAAKAQGLIRASADIPTLLVVIDNVYTANIFSLSAEDVSEDVFEARAQYGFALAVSSVASAAHARRVRAFLEDCQARCVELEPEGPFAIRDLPRIQSEPPTA